MRNLLDATALAILAGEIFLVAFILVTGPVQFGGCDYGNMINNGWQMWLGYRPYRELVTYLPPMYMAGTRWAFSLWGVHFTSLVNLAAVFSAITFPIMTLLLIRLGFGKAWSIVFALCIQCMNFLLGGHWWYNWPNSILGALFLSSALLLYREPRSRFNNISFLTFMWLLSLGKPNVAGSLLIATWIVLMFTRIRFRVLALTAGAVLLSLGFLFAHRMNPLDVIRSYAVISGRPFRIDNILFFLWYGENWQSVITYSMLSSAVLGLLLTLSCALYSSLRRRASSNETSDPENARGVPLTFGFIGIAVGIFGMSSNGEFKVTDATLVLLGLAMIHSAFRGAFPLPSLRKTALGLLTVSAMGIAAFSLSVGWQRLRVRAIGRETFYTELPLTRLEAPPLFAGMRAGPRLIDTINQIYFIMRVFGYEGKVDAPVFFGTRLDWAYAMLGIHPAKGVCNEVWDQFASVRVNGKNPYIERFKQFGFKLCIFFRRDYVYIPDELLEYLYSDFDVMDFGELTVHVRRA